jgi:glycosyltransferase involved in cell wall biosynthesis
MKLTACILTYNHEDWIRTCLESLRSAVDRIIVIDGGSKDRTLDIIAEYPKAEVHFHKWRGNIGMQRNNYLRYLEDGEWAIVMDSDEVLSDNGFKIRDLLEAERKVSVFSVRMVHFMWHFGLIDATEDVHYVPRRVFRYQKGLYYPHDRHAVLLGWKGEFVGKIDDIIIYHCGYLSGMPDVAKKYREHVDQSDMHTPEFLLEWRRRLTMGSYPTKGYTGPYPVPLKEMFGI